MLNKTYEAGGVSITLRSYRTFRAEIFLQECVAMFGASQTWNNRQQVFAICDPLLQEVKVAEGELSQDGEILKEYMQKRTENLAGDWNLFLDMFNFGALKLLWDAYLATRDNSIEIPPDVPDEKKMNTD